MIRVCRCIGTADLFSEGWTTALSLTTDGGGFTGGTAVERDAGHLDGPHLRRDAAHHALQPRLFLLLPSVPQDRPEDARRGRAGRRRVGEPLVAYGPVLGRVARRRAARRRPGALRRVAGAVRGRRRAPRADQRHADRRRLV